VDFRGTSLPQIERIDPCPAQSSCVTIEIEAIVNMAEYSGQ